MITDYYTRVAIDAAERVWGITLKDLRNRSDEELVLMRQIVVARLSENLNNRSVSEVIDRSESTIETDIFNHQGMVEDGFEDYKKNNIEFIEAFEKIEDELVNDALHDRHYC